MSETAATTYIQGDDVQKLIHVDPLDVSDNIEEGILVFAATSKEHGLQVEEVDLQRFIPGLLSSPEKGSRHVTDCVSFLAELDRFKLDDAATLWGDETKGKVVAIYNDHTNKGAGHRDNRLELTLRPDEDWQAWQRLSGKFMQQSEFGDAVEELLHTVVSPSQAELMEVIDSVRATTKGNFESSITRATGGQTVAWTEEVETRAGKTSTLQVPTTLTLALSPFEGMDTYGVEAWFRIRVTNGQLLLAVKLKPTRAVVRKAWSDLVETIEEKTTKPVLATRF